MRGVEASHAAEPRDVAWAREAEVAITEAAAAPGLGPHTLESVDCRQTICRVRISSATELEARRFGVRFTTHLATFPESLQELVGEDRNSTVFYFARPGTSLPAFEPPR